MDGLLRTLLVSTLLLPAAGGRAMAEEPVVAVWKERPAHFSYRGFAAVYPCSVLQNRIALVLTAIGARPDLRVTVNHCDASFDSSTMTASGNMGWPQGSADRGRTDSPTAAGIGSGSPARDRSEPGGGYYRRSEPRQVVDVRVLMSVPVEVTPEVIAELKTDRKRRELISRVTGDPLPLFDDPIPFPAQRQVVTLSHETGLEAFDCELLDEMASSVLPELDVRVLKRRLRCDHGAASRLAPSLEVEALLPVTSMHPARRGEATVDDRDPPGSNESGGAPAGR
jgi:hypothetical protein